MPFDWTAPDGKILPAESWLPPAKARAVVVGVHGLGGAADYFGTLGEFLAQAGFATYAVNLRGQGCDPDVAHRGADLNLPAIAGDIAAFSEYARATAPGVPLFFCGESMGSLIIAWMIAQRRLPETAGVIFSVPVVALIKPTPWIVRKIVHAMGVIAPGVRFSPAWFVNGKAEPLSVTRDKEYENYVRTAPHKIRVFTFRTLSTLGRLIESSPLLAPKITLPSLILAAGDDVFVTVEQVESWFEKIASTDKTLWVYPDAYHLLWNDLDKNEVLSDTLAWLEKHMPSAKA